jgi:hypothetical protein
LREGAFVFDLVADLGAIGMYRRQTGFSKWGVWTLIHAGAV